MVFNVFNIWVVGYVLYFYNYSFNGWFCVRVLYSGFKFYVIDYFSNGCWRGDEGVVSYCGCFCFKWYRYGFNFWFGWDVGFNVFYIWMVGYFNDWYLVD